MPAPARSPQSRPSGAPAYYLGRPAAWWLTALHGPYQDRTRAGQHLSPGLEGGQ